MKTSFSLIEYHVTYDRFWDAILKVIQEWQDEADI